MEEFPKPSRIMFSASGAGKSTWVRQRGIAVDGDHVIQAVLGWRNVRTPAHMAPDGHLTGDISPVMRISMDAVLHTYSSETLAVVVFNGQLFRREHAFFAHVEIPLDVNVRQYAAREEVTLAVARDRVNTNRRSNQRMAVDLGADTFASFDAASQHLDELLLRSIHAHTKKIQGR